MIDSSAPERDHPREVAAELYGERRRRRSTRCARAGGGPDRSAWVSELRAAENEKRAAEQDELTDDRSPLHPMRVYGELAQVLDRNAVVIGDGGDFVSFAGRDDRHLRARLLAGPGPVRLPRRRPGLRAGGQARAPGPAGRACCSATARSASRGWSSTRSSRHGVPVVGVMGNNGIWALEKHPMEFLYGYSVAADLQPGLRYDQMVEALGGHGELVRAAGASCARRWSARSRAASRRS